MPETRYPQIPAPSYLFPPARSHLLKSPEAFQNSVTIWEPSVQWWGEISHSDHDSSATLSLLVLQEALRCRLMEKQPYLSQSVGSLQGACMQQARVLQLSSVSMPAALQVIRRKPSHLQCQQPGFIAPPMCRRLYSKTKPSGACVAWWRGVNLTLCLLGSAYGIILASLMCVTNSPSAPLVHDNSCL